MVHAIGRTRLHGAATYNCMPAHAAAAAGLVFLRRRTRVAALEVLSNQPGFKRRVQEARRDAAQHAADHEHPVVGGVLGAAGQRVGDDVAHRGVLAAAAGVRGVLCVEGGVHAERLHARMHALAAERCMRRQCVHGDMPAPPVSALQSQTHALSASAPTKVPNSIEEPKPAMNSWGREWQGVVWQLSGVVGATCQHLVGEPLRRMQSDLARACACVCSQLGLQLSPARSVPASSRSAHTARTHRVPAASRRLFKHEGGGSRVGVGEG